MMRTVGPLPRKQPRATAVPPVPRRRGPAWKIGLVVALFTFAIAMTVWPRAEALPECPGEPPPVEEELSVEEPEFEMGVSAEFFEERSIEPWSEEP